MHYAEQYKKKYIYPNALYKIQSRAYVKSIFLVSKQCIHENYCLSAVTLPTTVIKKLISSLKLNWTETEIWVAKAGKTEILAKSLLLQYLKLRKNYTFPNTH